MLAASLVPLLLATAGVHVKPAEESTQAHALPERTVWADIGVSAQPGKLTAKQIEKLCETPAMLLEKTHGSLVQTFYAGITMSTRYTPIKTVSAGSLSTVYLYNPTSGKLAEILEFAPQARFLMQRSNHFRPHAYARCSRWEAASPSVSSGRQ